MLKLACERLGCKPWISAARLSRAVSNPRLGARARAVDTHGAGRRIHDGRSDAPTIPTAGAPAKMELDENENERLIGKA
jgi:hypothetical protein